MSGWTDSLPPIYVLSVYLGIEETVDKKDESSLLRIDNKEDNLKDFVVCCKKAKDPWATKNGRLGCDFQQQDPSVFHFGHITACVF